MECLRIRTRKMVIPGISGIYENSELPAKCRSRCSGAQNRRRIVNAAAANMYAWFAAPSPLTLFAAGEGWLISTADLRRRAPSITNGIRALTRTGKCICFPAVPHGATLLLAPNRRVFSFWSFPIGGEQSGYGHTNTREQRGETTSSQSRSFPSHSSPYACRATYPPFAPKELASVQTQHVQSAYSSRVSKVRADRACSKKVGSKPRPDVP